MGTNWKGDHLWLYLLALGFQPNRYHVVRLGRVGEGEVRSFLARVLKTRLERNMFDKPNSKAFAVIACFLFAKLDENRATQTFKSPGFTKLSSPRFRKRCCLWLREISRQKEAGLPQITPSTLIFPGGAKFIDVVYHFARYVMIENMKKLSVGTRIPFAEAVIRTPKDMYIAAARHRVAYNKLLQIFQREEFVIQEYKKKAQVLIREIKRTKSEYAVLQKQSCRMKQNDQNKNDTTERIQKVRSMWTLIVEMLTSLKKEKEVVDSVVEDCVKPCILDGADVVLSVPQLLTYRVESNIYAFCTGNLYEDGKLNFLVVIQLLNEALMTLRDERCPCELKELHRIEDVVTSYKNALQKLNTTSLRRKQQHCEPKHQSISRRQEIWESKWKTFLGQCPFNLVFKDDLQPASSLQSSSSSDEDENSVFCQSFSDDNDSCHEECHGKNDETLEAMGTLVPSRCDFIQHGGLSASEATDSHFPSPFLRPSVELLSEASENGDLLIENSLHTCVGNKKSVPPKILKNGKEELPTSEMESAAENVTQPKSPVEKDDLLKKARDELAEEIAKSVMSESPDSREEKGMALDDLVSSLTLNPFLTRRQIPRTPENLLTEIRSSWRKAIQTEGSLDLELSSTEVVTAESSMNATPSMQEEVDSTSVCSEPTCPVSDFGPPVSGKKSQLSSTESSSQEQVSLSHEFESSVSKTSGIQESERTEVVTAESSMNATPSMQEEVDSTSVCSEPTCPVSDFGPPVSGKKSQLSSTESSSQEQVSLSHEFESSVSKTSGIQESERTESEELYCSALSASSVEDLSQTLQNVEKNMNIPDTCLRSGSRTNTLLSDHCCSVLLDEMLCCNVSLLNSVGHETTEMGILDETLPESDGIDLSISASSDSIFYTMDSANLTDGLENNEDIKKLDLDTQSLSNSREVLKRTASKSEEDLYQTNNGDKSESYRAELSTILEEERNDHSTDEGFTKMPLPNSPKESKYSLSTSLVSCQQMDSP